MKRQLHLANVWLAGALQPNNPCLPGPLTADEHRAYTRGQSLYRRIAIRVYGWF